MGVCVCDRNIGGDDVIDVTVFSVAGFNTTSLSFVRLCCAVLCQWQLATGNQRVWERGTGTQPPCDNLKIYDANRPFWRRILNGNSNGNSNTRVYHLSVLHLWNSGKKTHYDGKP